MICQIPRLFYLLLPLVFLAACGSPSNVEKPTELKSFDALYRAKPAWTASFGAYPVATGRINLGIGGNTVYVADGEGVVYALDANSGKQQWRVETGAPLSSALGMSGKLLALALRNGRVVAITTDGEVRWSADVAGEVLAAPAIWGNTVVVQTSDGRISGLAANDGNKLWTYERTVPSLTLRGSSGPVVVDGLAVAGFSSGLIVGLDARNGRLVWEKVVALPSGRSDIERLADVDTPPVITGYHLFAASYQGQLMAMDLRNGNVLWSRPFSSYLPLAHDASRLYLVNDQGVVVAVDQASGADVWAQNDLRARTSGNPVVTNGVLIVGDVEGYIHLLDTATGKIVGRSSIGSGPVISQGGTGTVFYSVLANGKLSAYTMQAL